MYSPAFHECYILESCQILFQKSKHFPSQCLHILWIVFWPLCRTCNLLLNMLGLWLGKNKQQILGLLASHGRIRADTKFSERSQIQQRGQKETIPKTHKYKYYILACIREYAYALPQLDSTTFQNTSYCLCFFTQKGWRVYNWNVKEKNENSEICWNQSYTMNKTSCPSKFRQEFLM